MTAPDIAWRVRLSAAAEADFQDILRWTAARFGTRQARIHEEVLSEALMALAGGPELSGVKARDDIMPGLFSLHVARHGRKGRHIVLFRPRKDEETPAIDVLRILHDAMDPIRHLPTNTYGE